MYLVTGAGGQLGRALAEEFAADEVVALAHSDWDVSLPPPAGLAPGVVLHAAAWTDVDGAEDDPEGTQLVNGTGAGNAAAAAAAVGAKIVYVSSDYVFSGDKGDDYVETDQTGPISVYGASKLAGEVATATANRRSMIVRSSWLFGISGPNFVNTMIRLGETQGQVLVVHDQVGSPTYTWHLAYGLVRLLDSEEYGVHHMAAAGSCSWYEFAKEIFKLSEMDVVTLSATTEMFGAKAPRPERSVLVSANEHAIRLPSWQDGLASYLAQKQSATVSSEEGSGTENDK